MADFKRKTLSLSTGKQIKLFGDSIAISKSLELAEAYAPNILSASSTNTPEKSSRLVCNPYQLTEPEILELADYNIRLWMELKDNIRKHGLESPKIFKQES
jgi:hypothetical protein